MTLYTDNPALGANQAILVNRITVDGQTINASPAEIYSVSVSSHDLKHDQAVITTKLTKTQAKEFLDKTVSFSYGPVTNRGSFFGYVSVVSPSRSYQQDLTYDITCLGVTKPLQTGEPRFFRNRTGPEIAAEIVGAHRLGFYSDFHGFRWPSVGQTGESDWNLVCEVAVLCGFSVFVDQGVVRLVNSDHALRTQAPVVHLLKGDQVLDRGRELLDFNPVDKSTTLRPNIVPSYGYFNPSGDPAVTTNSESETRLVTDVPILSKGMADTLVTAFQKSSQKWNQTASARIIGNPSIKPGMTVSIQLGGSSVVANDYDGVWLVKGVEHSLTHNSFQTNLSLGRDTKHRPTNTAFQQFYSNVSQGKPKVLLDSSNPDSKRWKSSWGTPYFGSSTVLDTGYTVNGDQSVWVPTSRS